MRIYIAPFPKLAQRAVILLPLVMLNQNHVASFKRATSSIISVQPVLYQTVQLDSA